MIQLSLAKALCLFARPGAEPSLAFDWTRVAGIDPRIAFTRASNAAYFDNTGVLRTAAADVARFDHDPATKAARGLLIEEARTNLALYSEDLSNAAYGKSATSIAADATAAPDGATTADKVVESNTNAEHTVAQTVTISSGQTLTITVFAKKGERSRFAFYAVPTNSLYASFDVDAGTVLAAAVVGGGAIIATSIEPFANGFYRCRLTATFGTDTSIPIRFQLIDSGSGPGAYLGDGSSGMYFWGFDAQVGGFATSYIKTTSASATRAADVASINTLAPWFNGAEGTIFVDLRLGTVATGERQGALFQGDGNNRIRLSPLDAVLRAQVGTAGVFFSQDAVGGLSAGALVKAALAYKAGDYATAGNGGAVLAGSSPATLPSLSRLDIGSDTAAASQYLNGHLRRLSYWPRRLPNNMLKALTQ